MSSRQLLADRGFLTFAIGKEYLQLAKAQAMSIKLTQSEIKNFAVVIDKDASHHILDDDASMFDKIIVVDHVAEGWDMRCEWMAFNLTPWRETIKTDADIIFTAPVDHWFTACQHRDIVISNSIVDFRGDSIMSRKHRQLFDTNGLPDVYSAMTYFRYSKGAQEFFRIVKQITEDWSWYAKDLLIKNDDMRPRTDEIFALSAMLLGKENFTLPNSAVLSFVHMKEMLNGLDATVPWHEQIYSYWKKDKLFVGNIAQMLPFHYHQKGWMNNEQYDSIRRDYQEFIRSDRELHKQSPASP